EFGDMLEYKYACAKCGLTTTLNKSIEEKGEDFLNVLYSKNYKDAEIINLDGDLIRVQREGIKDDDYRIDAKISKNKKGELQLMVLAGSKKEEDKTQLFLDPTHERLAFDQNDSHPREVFSKVVAIFKNSTSAIGELPNDLDV
ncbi:MAG TPA: GH32 C-terminal domain-containing protein, partial [Candidatus Absconditabacterales bacterium]|nr:GH32 C-terminal domain-containing protein [Candidatus Absconditabacterales bacterium]